MKHNEEKENNLFLKIWCLFVCERWFLDLDWISIFKSSEIILFKVICCALLLIFVFVFICCKNKRRYIKFFQYKRKRIITSFLFVVNNNDPSQKHSLTCWKWIKRKNPLKSHFNKQWNKHFAGINSGALIYL